MRKVKNIVIIGVGQMGKGIAQVCLMAGYNVILNDVQNNIIESAVTYIENGINKLEKKGQLREGLTSTRILENMKTTTNLIEAVNEADYIRGYLLVSN